MSSKQSNKTPITSSIAGFSPVTPSRNSGDKYNTYNQPGEPQGGQEFGINDQGESFDTQQSEALNREERGVLRKQRRDVGAAVNDAENAAEYTKRKAHQVYEEVDFFLDEADKLYDSLDAMKAKMKRAVTVAERAKNASVLGAAETAQTLEESRDATERAIDLVNQTSVMVEQFKRDTINYLAGVGDAQRAEVTAKLQEIDTKMKELDEKTKELAAKKNIDPALVEELKKENESIKTVVATANATAPTTETEGSFQRSKMGICYINFEGYTNILNPFAKDRRSNNIINPILPVNFNVNFEDEGDFLDVDAGNYLFVDNFKLKLADFRSMNRTDFIELILNPSLFIEFLKKLEKSDVERQFVDFRKKDKLSKENREINKENAKIYAAKLFATEDNFNIVNPNGGVYYDYIIMSHELKKKGITGPDAFRFDVDKKVLQNDNTKEGYTFFTFKIKLILDSRERSEITPNDLKIVGCNQRKARIFKIMGSLEGTKQIITTIMGEEGAKKYLVDDTKMEELQGRAKPLPSKTKIYKKSKAIADKMTYVSKIDGRDLPISRSNEADALRRQQLGQRSLSAANRRIEGGKKTKRIIYHKNKDKDKDKNKKTKKGIYNKKHKLTKKLIKKQKHKKTRKQ